MNSIFEVVKTVNGIDIFRVKGSNGLFHIRLDGNRFLIFHTLEEAVAYIQKNT